jgi:hypothetical protein
MQHVWARTASWRTVVRIARAAFLYDIACYYSACFILEQSHCQRSKALMPRRKRENQLGSWCKKHSSERKAYAIPRCRPKEISRADARYGLWGIICAGGVRNENEKRYCGCGIVDRGSFRPRAHGGEGGYRYSRSHGHELRLLRRSSAVCTGTCKRCQRGRRLAGK